MSLVRWTRKMVTEEVVRAWRGGAAGRNILTAGWNILSADSAGWTLGVTPHSLTHATPSPPKLKEMEHLITS